MPAITCSTVLFLGRQLHFRLHGEPEIVVGHDLGVDVAHRGLDRLGHGGAAIDALQMLDRHLAGPEAVDRTRSFISPSRSLTLASSSPAGITTLNSRRRPSETVSVTCMNAFLRSSPIRRDPLWRPDLVPQAWCGRRDLNPHDLRHWNLNPARLPVPPRPLTGHRSGDAELKDRQMNAPRDRLKSGRRGL